MFDVHPRRRRATSARSLAGAVLMFLGAASAPAQSPPSPPSLDSLRIGARVRAVTSSDGATIEGFVRAVGADTLRVGTCRTCDDRPAIPLETLRYLQVQERRSKITVGRTAANMVEGALLGIVAGGLTGAAVAYHEVHQPNCEDLCGLSWLAVPYLGAIGGGAGLVTGGVVGLMHHESYWVGVRLPVSTR